MRKNFDIISFIAESEERYSGFVADDLDYVGQDQYAEGAQVASPSVMQTSPTPYQISIYNSTGGTLNAIIFGKNKYLLSTNYGSATGITITPGQTNVSYLELLQQSADEPFETQLIRVSSSTTNQPIQILTVTSKDANGQTCDIPIIAQNYFSANQFQSTIIDIPYELKIDGNTYITYPVLAGATVTMTFFPKKKVNRARQLAGKDSLRNYGAAAVAIGMPTVAVKPLV